MQATEISYPPLNTPKPVADGVWVVDSEPLHPAGVAIPVRMTVIRLATGELWLHSPTRFDAVLLHELEMLGPVRHLVAPNIAHWSFLKDWQQHCPDASIWAAPNLRNRRAVKKANLRIDKDLDATAPEAWSGEIEQTIIAGGGGFREVAFLHLATRTLILTDLIVNLEPQKLPFRSRTFARMTGTLAPDGKAPAYLRLLVRLRRKEARAAADRVVGWAPKRVIFAHGAWFERDGVERLKRSLAWLLG